MRQYIWIGVTLALAASAPATFLFDDFLTGPYNKTLTSGSDLSFQTGSMVGGRRMTLLEVLDNPFGNALEFGVGNGLVLTSSGSGLRSSVSLSYGFKSDGQGGFIDDYMSLDMTNMNIDRMRIRFLSNDRNLGVSVTLISGNGSKIAGITRNVAGNRDTPFVEEFFFSGFSGQLDLSKVDQIHWKFESSPGGDYALSNLDAVPEPATFLILGSASLVALARRRRR